MSQRPFTVCIARYVRIMARNINKRTVAAVVAGLLALGAAGVSLATEAFRFPSIDGGDYLLSDWSGRPVLVVNTASQCAFTPQYDGIQALYDTYRDRGLVVLAVPSDDFAQELDSNAAVKDFCEVNFNLNLPMTEITPVKGDDAHPFYRWVAETYGFTPRWNFNKILLGGDGQVVATFGSNAKPMGRQIVQQVEALLP